MGRLAPGGAAQGVCCGPKKAQSASPHQGLSLTTRPPCTLHPLLPPQVRLRKYGRTLMAVYAGAGAGERLAEGQQGPEGVDPLMRHLAALPMP